nr:class I SAM-dependent methyltransferase [Pullulanibacillus pueri]
MAKLGISSAHPGGLPLTKTVLDFVQLKSGERILDVGCGTGETSVYLAKHYASDVVAVDNHPLMIARAKERIQKEAADVELLQANVEHLPLKNDAFDKVLAESVTVFTNIEKTLREYHRVLRAEGILIDIEMTSERQLTPEEEHEIKQVYGIHHVLTEQQWETAMKQAGFKQVKIYNGLDFLKYNMEMPSAPSIDLSQSMDAEAFGVWLSHIKIMDKYHELNYRIYIAHA